MVFDTCGTHSISIWLINRHNSSKECTEKTETWFCLWESGENCTLLCICSNCSTCTQHTLCRVKSRIFMKLGSKVWFVFQHPPEDPIFLMKFGFRICFQVELLLFYINFVVIFPSLNIKIISAWYFLKDLIDFEVEFSLHPFKHHYAH